MPSHAATQRRVRLCTGATGCVRREERKPSATNTHGKVGGPCMSRSAPSLSMEGWATEESGTGTGSGSRSSALHHGNAALFAALGPRRTAP
mmetsp:Transcript_24894/g.37884  ORF Transcript_24894/g.37884 Transcript_24894/m.37884 type:complete len:91 (-) Transcript_24894:192-464(-)